MEIKIPNRYSVLSDNSDSPISTSNQLPVVPYVWNTVTLQKEIATQTAVYTGQMTVSGTTDITKIGGVNVGAANGMYVRPGTAETFPVSGTFWQATQPVSGTFWQATQPVSGPVTDTQLRATAVPTKTYGQTIAEGGYADKIKWSKVGYCPIPVTTETDIWSYGAATAVIPLITVADTMRVKTNNAADTATTLFGPTTADGLAGANKTSLVDADVNFNTVEVGDCVILDKAGTTPAWGYVSDVTNKATGTLLVSDGFSDGGGSGGRSYIILDQNVAVKTGAQAVYIGGLDANYAQQAEIVLTAGAGPGYTATVKSWYRINEFRVISVGTTLKSTDYVALADKTTATIYYSYITAGYNRARNNQYTVPAGKTLWITQWNAGFGFVDAAKAQNQYCRLYTRANQYSSPDNSISFKTKQSNGVNVWYPYSEVLLSGGSTTIVFDEPTKILQKVTVKVSGVASTAGFVTSVLRGYLTTN